MSSQEAVMDYQQDSCLHISLKTYLMKLNSDSECYGSVRINVE